jgi:hypothetical protein
MTISARLREQQEQEEEEMSAYDRKDLSEDWEFKILRSLDEFGHPEYLRQALQEESRAGWVLVEKLDDSRVRLKRPASAKARDATLDFDAYRSYVAEGPGIRRRFVMGLLIGGLVAVASVAGLFFWLLVAR